MKEKDTNYGFRFRDWDIYKDALNFRKHIHELLKKYPKEEKFNLIEQTKRALTSIILNIAEGSNKNTNKEKCVYINRAHCSIDEVVACLDCALDDGYIRDQELKISLDYASSLARRLKAFTLYLARTPNQQSTINNQ